MGWTCPDWPRFRVAARIAAVAQYLLRPGQKSSSDLPLPELAGVEAVECKAGKVSFSTLVLTSLRDSLGSLQSPVPAARRLQAAGTYR